MTPRSVRDDKVYIHLNGKNYFLPEGIWTVFEAAIVGFGGSLALYGFLKMVTQ